MADANNMEHSPTVDFLPQINGTVERLNRDIFTAMRTMLGEIKIGSQDWGSVIYLLRTVLI